MRVWTSRVQVDALGQARFRMNYMSRLLSARNLTLLLLLAGATSAACATRINKVLAEPDRYQTERVTVSGRVVETFSLAGRGAYLLDDGTGRLWVVVDRGSPGKGARVKARGTVRQAFNLGSLGDLVKIPGVASGVVLVEDSRSARD
jgi:hypothetical protein